MSGGILRKESLAPKFWLCWSASWFCRIFRKH